MEGKGAIGWICLGLAVVLIGVHIFLAAGGARQPVLLVIGIILLVAGGVALARRRGPARPT